MDGLAVYEARTMLFSPDSAFFSLGNSCEFPTYNDPNGKRENEENEKAESDEELRVRVYQNPTTGVLNIGFIGETDGSYNLRMITIGGLQVKQKTLVNRSIQIDIGDLSKGIYFIEVTSDTDEYRWKGKVVLIE